MPIRLNLLAEAQAAEDLRRRDPVKRVIWVGLCLILLVLAWSSSLQLQAIISKGEVNRLEGQLAARTNEFQQVLANQRKLGDVNRKLVSLHQLASSRLLYGNLLNALQQATLDDVQLTRVHVEQVYTVTEEVKPKTNAENHVIAGKPSTATEKIILTLEARDSGANPGDQVNRFRQTVADFPYFQNLLGRTNEVRLNSLSPPRSLGGKAFVDFTLECRFPEKTR